MIIQETLPIPVTLSRESEKLQLKLYPFKPLLHNALYKNGKNVDRMFSRIHELDMRLMFPALMELRMLAAIMNF